MSDLRLRPRFKLTSNESEEELINKIKTALIKSNPDEFTGKIKHKHLIIRVNPKKKHFWSPVLDISFEQMPDKKTQIRCLLAPEANVWTMFMFAYTISIFGSFIGLIIGSSQIQLEHNPWGFWLSTTCVLMGMFLFFIAQFGKKMAKEEMISLRLFIIKAINQTQP